MERLVSFPAFLDTPLFGQQAQDPGEAAAVNNAICSLKCAPLLLLLCQVTTYLHARKVFVPLCGA